VQVCALESMRTGLATLDAAGVRRHEELAKCPIERLALLAHMLPRRQESRDAALFAVCTAASAPWTLTENFLACTKADTQKMFLSISGASCLPAGLPWACRAVEAALHCTDAALWSIQLNSVITDSMTG
jgi:hypothetical protein